MLHGPAHVDSLNKRDVVALRGHHLLCLLAYRGAGYTPEFVENFTRIAESLSHGCEVRIVEGIDDVCAPLCRGSGRSLSHDCNAASVRLRDALALEALNKVFGFSPPWAIGSLVVLTPGFIREARKAFASGAIRPACAGCEWHAFCSEVAALGFRDAKLFPEL